MRKYIISSIIIISLILVVVFYFNNQSKINSTTNIELKIDSIKHKQDSLRLILPKIDSQIISK